MTKYDLTFDPPVMNAAGILGFTPDPHGPVDLNRLGAFITNPVSLRPRNPAGDRCYLPYPGGFLLHSGYPNPGIRKVIQRYAKKWERSPLPVLVHLLAQDASELVEMVRRLEEMGCVAGLELGIPPQANAQLAFELVQATVGELPVVARLPLARAVELAPELAGTGLAAISLGPPRGALPAPDGALVHGRLYGPALLPLAVNAIEIIRSNGLPVIGAGGIYTRAHMQAMLSAGAVGVQLDTVLWRAVW